MRFFITFILIFSVSVSSAQLIEFKYIHQDTTYSHISDILDNVYLKTRVKSKIKTLNYISLNRLIANKTSVFIKEYGRGMISSISIRGTGASHTQVLWNGIPINSSLNGQTDLNTVYVDDYNYLFYKKGGESVFFGSGAIGGIIGLEHKIIFRKTFKIENNLKAGSFESLYNAFKITKSNGKYYINISMIGNYSKNNYKYPKYDITNENGQFLGKDFSLNYAYKLSKKNKIILRSHLNLLNRNLSRTLFSQGNSKLNTSNSQNLISWNYNKNNYFSNNLTTAFVYERYDYFNNKNNLKSDINKSNKHIIKNTSKFKLNNNDKFIFTNQFDYSLCSGKNIGKHKTQNYALFFSWIHKYNVLKTNLSIRKEFNSLYKIPFLGALKLQYDNPKSIYENSIEISKNYKTPTYNDLFWIIGGNPDLKPEKSYTFEIYQRIKLKNFYLSLNIFYINSSNLIKWQPVTNEFWTPVNIEKTHSKGVEFSLWKHFYFINDYSVNITGNYTYQIVNNEKVNKILAFVPQHIGKLSVEISKGNLLFNILNKYTGKIYTSTDNTLSMSPYLITDLFVKYKLNNVFTFGTSIQNIFNTYYETFPSRPQPGRNYNLNINIKIQ